ncbi:PIN domain-containing protein [Actinocatenispora comari]|jgi:hypothetical protein|uniref:NTP pyrophosphohydrolase n=1 Tax=Actinocatenispora comari TaxID=2807577 RepID=A0A8J4EKU5_9ACTN|nr:hypothetical protein [Actinocatenispora comari]GIL27475.1 hypothetical protein NUM_27290 [Actinocatenispora comari]
MTQPVVVVDAANVVGSVPDGWWRDRAGAAARLRDALVPLAAAGLAADAEVPAWARGGPVRMVLVVEGAARRVAAVPGVEVVSAPRSGDDAIVAFVRAEPAEHRLVVTADRELRERVRALGAAVAGPRAVYRPPGPRS